MIHIGLAADENFALPLGVCITSIFESNRNNKLIIHILTPGFSKDNLERFKLLAEKYNQQIFIHQIDEKRFDNLPISKLFPVSVYFRFLFPEIIPQEVDKVLYMDCDTIILQDLMPLYSINLDEYSIAAAEDRNSDDIKERNRIEVFDGIYFNSGVLLINLDYWRTQDAATKLMTFIADNPLKCLWPDQDALNIIFHNKVKILPAKYNFQMSFIESLENLRLHKAKWPEIIDSAKDIVILHYATKEKPWNKESKHPLAVVWRHYYKMSLWNETPLKRRLGFTDSFINWYKRKVYGWRPYTIAENMKGVIDDLNKKYGANMKVTD